MGSALVKIVIPSSLRVRQPRTTKAFLYGVTSRMVFGGGPRPFTTCVPYRRYLGKDTYQRQLAHTLSSSYRSPISISWA